ncbi:MAG: protein-methionine-sulfoxide reductase catalytic subunit MsrP [Verrucomicrobia bacterium]|nr:protein-methionine-sulfoxide reductase catalytic subunit MsrP [Verrucomicrobiota bacterium]
MYIHKKPSWYLPDSGVTPQAAYLGRRKFLRTLGMGAAATAFTRVPGISATAGFPDTLNPSFKLSAVKLTPYDLITTYNNFYEWGLSKDEPSKLSNQGWKTDPWTIEIGGLCANPAKFAVNDLIKAVGGIEQRNYRHRCVEAWSMVVPWDGFPLAKLVTLSSPKPEAKYVQFTSFLDPKICPAQRSNDFAWPFTEGLMLDEAMNELAFLATGIYGKPLLNQNGAPIRLVVPWKYGFKGAKSIVRIDFVATQPKTLWNQYAPDEYGFLANVNPEVDHPRWSQRSERVIGGGFFSSRQPTLKFNGYEKEVAALYAGIDLRKNF